MSCGLSVQTKVKECLSVPVRMTGAARHDNSREGLDRVSKGVRVSKSISMNCVNAAEVGR